MMPEMLKMKAFKSLIFLWSIILLFALAGCSDSAAVSIDGYEWEIHTIQSNESGAVLACSPEQKPVYENAAEIEMRCTAENGVFTLTDTTNGNIYEGTYKQIEIEKETVIYEITIGEEKGNAAASVTVYQNGDKIPTLILSAGDYALHFFPKQ